MYEGDPYFENSRKDHFLKDEKEKFKLVYILHVTPVLPMTCAVLGSN